MEAWLSEAVDEERRALEDARIRSVTDLHSASFSWKRVQSDFLRWHITRRTMADGRG
jgi:hypothetical protein